MADHHFGDLPFGHFGTAIYDTEEHEWHFQKSPEDSQHLRILQRPTADISPAQNEQDQPDGKRKTPVVPTKTVQVRTAREIQRFVQHHPDLQPAGLMSLPHLRTSAAVEDAASQYDPGKACLMSLGRVFDESLRRTVDVAAHATGHSGCDLRIVRVQLEKQGWDDSRNIWLEVPVCNGEQAIWKGAGAPIQQVVFAQPIETGDHLLAVRMLDRTLILRPVLGKGGLDRLRVSIVLDIPIDDTGGILHANVCFNPWFIRQFAIIDQVGSLHAWEFEGAKFARVKKIMGIGSTNEGHAEIHDGWGSLTWARGPTTLLVCRRRHVSLVALDITPVAPREVDVGWGGMTGWILDSALIPSHPEYVCVLTTTHIVTLRIQEDDLGQPTAATVLRVRHFLNPQTSGYRLDLIAEEDRVLIMIVSASNSLIVCYSLSFNAAGAAAISDPARLVIHDGDGPERLLDVQIRSIAYGQKTGVDSDILNPHLRSSALSYLAILCLDQDYVIKQHLVSVGRKAVVMASQYPTWKKSTTIHSNKVLKDDFVVDDDSEDDGNQVISDMPRRKARITRKSDVSGSTLDMQHIARQVQRDRRNNLPDIVDILENAREAIAGHHSEDIRPLKTIHRLHLGEVDISDVDHASSKVIELLQMQTPPQIIGNNPDFAAEPQSRLVMKPISVPRGSILDAVREDNPIPAVYDRIVSEWISSLPEEVPGAIRLAKERLARTVAAQIMLSSLVLCTEPLEELPEAHETPAEIASPSWELSIRQPRFDQASNISLGTTSASRTPAVLPTPSPSATPSVVTTSSQRSVFAAEQVAGLSRYTTFSDTPTSFLPRSKARVLAHWTIGADVNKYDWASINRKFQQDEEEDAESQLTERARARLKRKAERHIQRQRREAAASQQLQMLSSQMPELVLSASQPVAERANTQPQWEATTSQNFAPGPASQAIPGRFAARRPAKKKRKQGF